MSLGWKTWLNQRGKEKHCTRDKTEKHERIFIIYHGKVYNFNLVILKRWSKTFRKRIVYEYHKYHPNPRV